jgi:hypothetical protein
MLQTLAVTCAGRYEESMSRKKVLEDELNDLEGKLQRAEKLVTGEKACARYALLCKCSACCVPCLHALHS